MPDRSAFEEAAFEIALEQLHDAVAILEAGRGRRFEAATEAATLSGDATALLEAVYDRDVGGAKEWAS